MSTITEAVEHIRAAAALIGQATRHGDVQGYQRRNIVNDLESMAARVRRLHEREA